MNTQPFDRQRLRKWVFIILLMIGLALVIRFLSAAIIVVESEPSAQLYARQDDRPFSKEGTGTAKFRTYSSGTVFLEARVGEKATQKAIKPRRFRTTETNLDLKEVAPTEEVAIGPFVYPHIEDGFIYGINPHTNSLSVKPLMGNNAPIPKLPVLPFLKQVVWFAKNDFVYVAIGRGAGAVSDVPNDWHGNRLYTGAVRVPGSERDLALLAADGVFLSTGGDIEHPKKVANTMSNSQPNLFADGQFVFFSSLLFEPVPEEGDSPEGKETALILLDNAGSKKYEFTLPLKEPLLNASQISPGRVGLLTESGMTLLSLTTGVSSEQEFSFGEVEDFAVFGNRLLLLGESGLWEYDIDNQVFYRLAAFPTGEEYVGQSLSIIDGSLYFSSSVTNQAREEGVLTANSRVYRMRLN